jgi:hypothetical protein
VEVRPQRGRVHRRVQRRRDPLPPPRQHHPDPMDPETGSCHRQLTSGQDTWSARCGVIRTPGAAGGPGKPTGSNPGRAPRSDPTIGAHTQLRLARHLVEDLRRPWEKRATKSGRLSPARIRRGFRNIRPATAMPAGAPKPSRPGPGRPPGSRNAQRAPRHDPGKTIKTDTVVKGGQKQAA